MPVLVFNTAKPITNHFPLLLGLIIKGIEHEYVPVDVFDEDGSFNKSALKQLNPASQLPTFVVAYSGKVHTITQSLAILDFLDSIKPNPPFLPTNPIERAKALSIAEFINSGIQPLMNGETCRRVSNKTEVQNKWRQDIIEDKFQVLEEMLVKTSCMFCVRNSITLADICLVPQVYSAQKLNVKIDDFPIIGRIFNTLTKLEPFQKEHAFKKPDAKDKIIM